VIRTIWLGFTFLIILAGAGSFRFAFGHFDAANASGIDHTEVDRTAASKAALDTLTKSDRLRGAYAYVSPAPDDAELAKTSDELAKTNDNAAELLSRILPAIVTLDIVALDIVDQRWHESAASASRPPRVPRAKRKPAKPDAIASTPPLAAEPKSCQMEEFDAFRWAFSLPTGCHT
jgi:hypothetical protein